MEVVADVEEIKRVITAQKSPKPKRRVAPKKEIPANVTLEEILNSLPKEVFTQDRVKAYGSLFITLASLSFSVYLLARAPWFVWPFAWIIGGASVTGLFAIGHDCVHRAFAKSKIVNDIVGTILMLPLGYSYESWKTCHKYQRAQQQPTSSNAFVNEIWNWAKGHTFWLASLGYWAQQHFDISYYKPEDRLRIRVSNYGVLAFGVVFLSTLFWYTGIIGIVKFWLLPWLGYHILMSTTTLLPSVVLDEKSASTLVHLTYPKWLEFLTNDISITLPRSISTSIPHYKLRAAYQALKKQWGEYFLEINCDWDLVTQLLDKTVPPEEYDPLTLKPLPVPGKENPVKDGHINPVPQPVQGFAGWAKSVQKFLANINWIHAAILLPTPLIAIYGLMYITPSLYTVVWTLFYYFLTGIGITAGYHRLWAHKAYSARNPTKFILLMLGTGAVQGSVRWWARDHRAHHRYTDTDKDPYNALRGFWYSHIGWMLVKQDPSKIGWASIEDLNQDPWIRWQHRNYLSLAVFMGVAFPTLVCCLWGDFWGGFFYAAILRQVLVHHNTFMVNSLAHFWGLAPFADEHSPRDSILTALLTFGEGYHNFHHEFPSDYRNAIKFYQYDPTKWVITALSYIGQTYDLKIFPDQIVKKGQIQMKQKEIEKQTEKIDWGTPLEKLPVITRATFDQVNAEGFKLVIINGVVHDVSDFINEHPGGHKIMEPFCGKDATKAFTGGVYYHSNAARNALHNYRIGTIKKDDNWQFGEVVVEEGKSQSQYKKTN
jgi:stearoyl-CoA desaturase (delta-9 desaturase)